MWSIEGTTIWNVSSAFEAARTRRPMSEAGRRALLAKTSKRVRRFQHLNLLWRRQLSVYLAAVATQKTWFLDRFTAVIDKLGEERLQIVP